jgi:hypothetical protein
LGSLIFNAVFNLFSFYFKVKLDLFHLNKKEWINCNEAIGDLDINLPEDKDNLAGSKHKNLLKQIPPGQNYLFFTKERGNKNPKFKWRSRYWSFLLKLSPKEPSWTIQASFSNNMGPFHWKSRFLRINEIKKVSRKSEEPNKFKLFELPGRPELASFFNEHVIDIIQNRERYAALGVGFPSAMVLHGFC